MCVCAHMCTECGCGVCVCLFIPETSPSSSRPVSTRVLKRVPMGSRGCPTHPSGLVMDVNPLWSRSEEPITAQVTHSDK